VAAREALLVVAVAVAVGEAVSLLLFAGGAIPGLTFVEALQGGIVMFLLFHHVGVQVATAALHLPHHADVVLGLPTDRAVDVTVALAFLGGTALVLVALARAGRVIGEATGSRPRSRGLSGARVAVPYALAAFVLGWFAQARVRFPQTGVVDLHPSHVASLMWPLVLAAAAGFAGGVRSGPGGAWESDWWESDNTGRRWGAAFAGAARTMVLGMALGLAGVLVLAVARVGDTAQFVADAFSGGPLAALGVAAMVVLALPNFALWAMAPAFGGCLEIASGFGYTTGPYCVVSLTHSPANVLATRDIYWGLPNLGPPPPGLWLFLLVPIIAVTLGTLHAVRVGRARTRREGALMGAMTGLVFIGMFLLALVLSVVTVRFGGPLSSVASGYFRYGPAPLDAIELGIVWCVLGGVVVGWFAGRRAERPRVRAEPADARAP
jgi:hypothetical protein